MARFSSRKWVACTADGCEGGADIFADNEDGRFFVDHLRLGGIPAYIFGDPEAKCNLCGKPVPMPTATAEQMDTERNPIYKQLQEWGLEPGDDQ